MTENFKYKKEVVGKRQMYRRIAKETRDTLTKIIQNKNNTAGTTTSNNMDLICCDNKPNVQMNNELDISRSSSIVSWYNNISSTEYIEADNTLPQIDSNQCNITDLKVKLRNWALCNKKVPLFAISDLLYILSPYHTELPLDARTLLHTPVTCTGNFKKLDGGNMFT